MAFRDFLPSADHLKPDMERTVRLAVTGLTRAGKTVFISSLIRNLLSADQHPANLPLLKVVRDGRFVTARLDHNAAVHAPLFPYEDCMRALCATAPAWPQPTTDISQIRIKIAFKPAPDTLTGRAGGLWLIGRAVPKHLILNVDVIDYPGEWLLDLPLETKTFAQWSDDMLALCAHQPRAALAREWLAYVGSRDERGPADEEFLANAARLYTAFLETCRAEPHCLKLLQPGHFLRPGQYRGSPLLRFCPLPAKSKRAAPRGSIRAVMEKRFDAFKKHVVRGFLDRHFRGFDRQIVLVDVLNVLSNGRAVFDDSCKSLNLIMNCFDFGGASLFSWFGKTRISKVLFAATKADQIAAGDQENLRALTKGMVRGPLFDAIEGDAKYEVMQIAAVKATEDVIVTRDGVDYTVLKGIREGGSEPVKWYPGAVPPSCPPPWDTMKFRFAAFKPRYLPVAGTGGIPNINLDRAIEFLIGEDLR